MVIIDSAKAIGWCAGSIVVALGVFLVGACGGDSQVSESARVEAAPTASPSPRHMDVLAVLPRSQAPLAFDRTTRVVTNDYGAVEPERLTNEAAVASDFLEDRSRPMLPRFELDAPGMAAAGFSESFGSATVGEPFQLSGARIGNIFDESDPAPSFLFEPTHSSLPWVSAVDEYRWGAGQQALAIVGIAPEALGYPVVFLGPNGGKKGTTFTVDRHIEVYISDDDSVRDIAHVLAHEFGHAFDVSSNAPEDRRRWLEVRNLPETTPWWPRGEVSDLTTGAGDFAECFASWRASVEPRSQLAGSCVAHFGLLDELWGRR